MSRKSLSLIAAITVSLTCLATAPIALASGPGGGSGGTGGNGGGGTCGCIALTVSKEVAPAGALKQMKVAITEPKPISTGTGSVSFDAFDSLVGIALSSHPSDAEGVAVVRKNSMTLAVISPTATFGSTIDYPLFTVVGHIPAGTPVGTKFPMTIDPNAIQFYDATGTLYPSSVKPGELVTNNHISIGNVIPGSAVVPPGGVVTITGVGFVPGTTIKFETKILAVQYVSPTRIDVVVGETTNMHGMMIKAANPDGSTETYFSYQRTRTMVPSADPVMQYVMPLLPPNEVTAAVIAIPAPAASTTYGVALQNIEAADTVATVELLDAAGNSVAATQVTVGASQFVVRELSELFGAAPADAATVRVTSPAPVEVLGVIADQSSGTARPILPR